jgi:hypothetical protein
MLADGFVHLSSDTTLFIIFPHKVALVVVLLLLLLLLLPRCSWAKAVRTVVGYYLISAPTHLFSDQPALVSIHAAVIRFWK